jgi:uncharacterized Zn-finger protein
MNNPYETTSSNLINSYYPQKINDAIYQSIQNIKNPFEQISYNSFYQNSFNNSIFQFNDQTNILNQLNDLNHPQYLPSYSFIQDQNIYLNKINQIQFQNYNYLPIQRNYSNQVINYYPNFISQKVNINQNLSSQPLIKRETKINEKPNKTEKKIMFKTTKNNIDINIKIEDLKKEENQNENDKTKNYYNCTFPNCNKIFSKELNFKEHIRTHTGEKPFKCLFPNCNKSFTQQGNLKKHEKIHLGNKNYICNICEKKFSANYNLKIHYRSHINEKPFKCTFSNCNKSFYDKGNLKYHERTVHKRENSIFPYSCEHMGCNKKFKTLKDKLAHHYENEIKCSIERKELIKLLQKYKILLKYIIKEKNIDVEKNKYVNHLKQVYEDIQKKLIDNELFAHYLGNDFYSDCINVEIEEKETEHSSSKAD